MLDISTLEMWNSVGAKRFDVLETSRRDFSGDVSFGIGTLLVVEHSSLEKHPRGVCVIYAAVCGYRTNTINSKRAPGRYDSSSVITRPEVFTIWPGHPGTKNIQPFSRPGAILKNRGKSTHLLHTQQQHSSSRCWSHVATQQRRLAPKTTQTLDEARAVLVKPRA